jgi:hypothetical protein
MTMFDFAVLIVTGRHRHILGHPGRSIAAVSTTTGDDGRNRARIRLVNHGNRGGTRLGDHARSPPHVVITDAAAIGRSTVRVRMRCGLGGRGPASVRNGS